MLDEHCDQKGAWGMNFGIVDEMLMPWADHLRALKAPPQLEQVGAEAPPHHGQTKALKLRAWAGGASALYLFYAKVVLTKCAGG
jgi:hypothetical protein